MSENGRTHEPSHKELTLEVSALRDLLLAKLEGMEKLAVERDLRYGERFEAMDEKTSLALTSSKEAVTKAEIATEKRFDAVNEFRGTLSDQAATLLPRAEANARFGSYDEKLEDLKKESAISKRWSLTTVVAIIFGAAGIIIGLVGILTRLPAK